MQSINYNRVLKNQEKIIIPSIQKEENDYESYNSKININTATIEELKQLDGIGEKTAEKIIEYREINEITEIEQLMNVNGIGEGKFNKIKYKICTE